MVPRIRIPADRSCLVRFHPVRLSYSGDDQRWSGGVSGKRYARLSLPGRSNSGTAAGALASSNCSASGFARTPFLSEELGWRGYALDALQARWGALVSSLIVGLFWSLWHVPLFFIRDETNFYYDWGFGTMLFWLFLLRMTLISVLITWIYNNNQRSILSAILLHFAYNFTFSFVYPIPDTMHLFGTLLILLMVIVIVRFWGPQTLTRSTVRVHREAG